MRGDVAVLELLQQLLERTGEGRRSGQLAVDIEGIPLVDKADLIGQVVEEVRAARELLARDDPRLRLEPRGIERIRRVAHRLARDALELGDGAADDAAPRNRPEVNAVIADGCADRVQREHDRDGRDGHGAPEKDRRVQPELVDARLQAGAEVDPELPPVHPLLTQRRAEPRQAADAQQEQLRRRVIRLRELVRLLRVAQLLRLCAQRAQPGRKARDRALNVETEPAGVLLELPAPVLDFLLTPPPEGGLLRLLLRRGVLVFLHGVYTA